MQTSFIRKHPALAGMLVAIPLVAILINIGDRTGPEGDHATGHLAMSVVPLLLLLSSRWWRQPADGRLPRVARWMVLVGLGMIGGSQLLESLAAFGYRGNLRVNEPLATLHDVAMPFFPLGVLVLLLGGTLRVAVLLMQTRRRRAATAGVMLLGLLACAALLKQVVLGA